VTYRGQMLEVEVGPQTVTYQLLEGDNLVIHHETEKIELDHHNPMAVRPVSRNPICSRVID